LPSPAWRSDHYGGSGLAACRSPLGWRLFHACGRPQRDRGRITAPFVHNGSIPLQSTAERAKITGEPSEDSEMMRIAVSALNSCLFVVAVVVLSSLASSAPVDPPEFQSQVRFVQDQDQDQGEGQDQEMEQDEQDTGEQDTGEQEDETEQKESTKETPDKEQDAEKKAEAKAEAKGEQQAAKGEGKSAGKQSEKSAGKNAAKQAAAKAEKAAKKRKTHKVEPKKLKVEVPLDGTFVARKMQELVLRPDAWTNYEIKEIVEHGAKVHQGQVLVKFDDERINEAIDDLELEQRLNELAIRRAEEELPRQERMLAISLENAERADGEAKQDYARYNEIDRPQLIKSVENNLKRSQFNFDYENDELQQLEKMYAADDLTEETEEVVLKRQRDLVQFARFSLENAKINREEILTILLPRFDVQMKQSVELAQIGLARAKMASTIDVNRGRYELEQRKQARARSIERHAKLIADRALMELKSPADGIVYYGQCVDGRWTDMASLINRLKPHNNVSAGTVIMTILEPRPLYVVANVDEAKRPEIAKDQKVKIAPPAEGSDRLDGKVEKVSAIPTGAGRFAVEFAIQDEETPDWIVAGMTCKLRVTSYEKADALTVPKAAVRTDEDDEDKKYVWLVVDPDDEEAKPQRRDVTPGKTSGNDTEIIKGLKKGDVISLEDEGAKAAAE
jgi:multidrug resistance efflux pump